MSNKIILTVKNYFFNAKLLQNSQKNGLVGFRLLVILQSIFELFILGQGFLVLFLLDINGIQNGAFFTFQLLLDNTLGVFIFIQQFQTVFESGNRFVEGPEIFASEVLF